MAYKIRCNETERIRSHIDDLFAADRPLPEILEEVARLGAELLMQAESRRSTRRGHGAGSMRSPSSTFPGREPLPDAPGSPAEPVLAACGIGTGGKPAFIGLAAAAASPPTHGPAS